jgi:hypothetical protein
VAKVAGMSALAVSLISLTACFCFAQASGGKTEIHSAQPQVAGVWRGNSVCAVKDSPCHDEVNVYRFSEVAGKPGLFSVTGSKIVDGKEVVMGTAEWKYDAAMHTLEADISGGVFRYVVDGDRMEGTLSLRDNTVYRRVHLVRQAGPPQK